MKKFATKRNPSAERFRNQYHEFVSLAQNSHHDDDGDKKNKATDDGDAHWYAAGGRFPQC